MDTIKSPEIRGESEENEQEKIKREVTDDIEMAMNIVKGTARSMGVDSGKEVQHQSAAGGENHRNAETRRHLWQVGAVMEVAFK